MRGKVSLVGLLALATALFVLAFSSSAFADTGDIVEPQNQTPPTKDGFQAGTCTTDEPPCSELTLGQFYTQAGGHPPIGFTQYLIRHTETTGNVEPAGIPIPVSPIEEPKEGRTIKTLRVDLPPGLTVNPQATPKCSQEDFEAIGEIPGSGGMMGRVPTCDKSTIVGREEVTLVVNTAGVVPAPSPPFPPGNTLPKGAVVAPDPAKGTKVPVYNLEPKPGEPARFGFVIAFSKLVYLETEVAWENDFHESFTIKPPEPSVPFSTLKSRLVNFGFEAGNLEGAEGGDGTYITNPTACFDPDEWPTLHSTWFRAESYELQNPTFPKGSTPWEADLPEGVEITGCNLVPFNPSIEATPTSAAIDSSTGGTVTTKLPFDPETEGGENGLMQSHLRRAEVSLPQGMGLNPSGANGLLDCKDSQFMKGVRVSSNACPASSRIGTAEIDSPPLAELLSGGIYVGEQKSSNPESGEMFRILVEAKNDNEGIVVRLVGNIKANAATGQLTAVFDEQQVGEFAVLPKGLPQVPFESVKLHFDAAKEVLTTPPTCATAETTGQMEPWARPGTTVPVMSKFTLTTNPNGGSCPTTMAARPFSPGFSGQPRSSKAGAYSPFELHISRPNGAQEIKRVDVDLPPGMVAKLRGVDYCPEASIDAAAKQSGAATVAKAACPDSSFVGTAGIAAGSGEPYRVNGNVYLAGPYKGAPVSLVFVTPAVAGPYDLGTVVVRVALNVDPETAEVHAVSDPIPDVFGGVKLDIRNIDVSINRKKFTLNPTTCRQAFPIGSGIFGGGGNPLNPAAWSESTPSSEFRARECRKLGFRPKFYARILSGENQTRRAANPKLRAILDARKGNANVRRAAFILPRATILDQSHIRTICTRVQLAADECPKAAIYGHAQATSPLLNGKLKGPVYLTSSNNELPDLLVDLRGQVDIQLRGVIGSKNGRLKTVFRKVPDVAVDKFILTMRGGNRGLLVNSENLCDRPRSGFLNLRAQNSRRLKSKNLRLNIPACG
jgi:hypothetical protein